MYVTKTVLGYLPERTYTDKPLQKTMRMHTPIQEQNKSVLAKRRSYEQESLDVTSSGIEK
jgi:hypothetical protein